MSYVFSPSFGLTESVDLFGQTNSADLVLNDIWMEPQNPKEGETVSVRGSVYNAGIISTEEVIDVVTIGYVVNGKLVEINVLENILPGAENGIEISSGPIFDAIPGNYIVTVIINYHDTLSHLRDNPENNIVQKRFQIANEIPSLVKYSLYQNYESKTNEQQITINGELTDIFQEKLNNQKVIMDFEGIQEETITDTNGEFSIEAVLPFSDEPIKVTATLEENSSFPGFSQMILPLKLNKEQAALALQTTSFTNNFNNSALTLVIFQDSYDNLFKKISTDKFDSHSIQIEDLFLTVLPANHEYIIEIYLEGRLLDAFQDYFVGNTVVKNEIFISESAEIQFRIINEDGEPQSNVAVNNWIYSSISDEDGFTDWMEVLPNVTLNEPYIAKATFPDGHVIWSEPFLIEQEDRKVIQIIQRSEE